MKRRPHDSGNPEKRGLRLPAAEAPLGYPAHGGLAEEADAFDRRQRKGVSGNRGLVGLMISQINVRFSQVLLHTKIVAQILGSI